MCVCACAAVCACATLCAQPCAEVLCRVRTRTLVCLVSVGKLEGGGGAGFCGKHCDIARGVLLAALCSISAGASTPPRPRSTSSAERASAVKELTEAVRKHVNRRRRGKGVRHISCTRHCGHVACRQLQHDICLCVCLSLYTRAFPVATAAAPSSLHQWAVDPASSCRRATISGWRAEATQGSSTQHPTVRRWWLQLVSLFNCMVRTFCEGRSFMLFGLGWSISLAWGWIRQQASVRLM